MGSYFCVKGFRSKILSVEVFGAFSMKMKNKAVVPKTKLFSILQQKDGEKDC